MGKFFELVNRIAYDMITHPREVDAVFDAKAPDPQMGFRCYSDPMR